jgi:DNA-binding NtrC family response regulator
VLIADSDPQLRRLLRVLLQHHYSVVEAPNAARALELLRATPAPLVVLWNLWLSQMAGPHVLDAIAAEPVLQRHAFVLLTVELEALSPLQRKQAQQLGFPVLILPFAVDEFQRLVAQASQTLDRSTQAENESSMS